MATLVKVIRKLALVPLPMVSQILDTLREETHAMTILTSKTHRDAKRAILHVIAYVSKMYEKEGAQISWHEQLFAKDDFKFIDSTNNGLESNNKQVKSEFLT